MAPADIADLDAAVPHIRLVLLVGMPYHGWGNFIDKSGVPAELTLTACDSEEAMVRLAVDPRIKTVMVDMGSAAATVAAVAQWQQDCGAVIRVEAVDGSGRNGTAVTLIDR